MVVKKKVVKKAAAKKATKKAVAKKATKSKKITSGKLKKATGGTRVISEEEWYNKYARGHKL